MRIPRRRPAPVPLHDMNGRVCVVTGASSGIGLETARGLVQRGATVLAVGRNPDRLEDALGHIGADGPGSVEGLIADFASLREVEGLAEALMKRSKRLHVLIHNAGLWLKSRGESHDGHELTFAVNHLAPFALTKPLLPILKASAPARVVTVSSRLHAKDRAFDFDDVHQRQRRYSGLRAYRQSKLANVLFTMELARRLEGSGVTATALNPGDVHTDVVRDSAFLSWGINVIGPMYLLTPEEGARTSLYAATAPELEGVSGAYFAFCERTEPSAAALDPRQAERLWALSEKLIESSHRY